MKVRDKEPARLAYRVKRQRRQVELSGALPCFAFFIQELLLQGGDTDMRGIELAAQELGVFEGTCGLGSQRFQCGDLLTEVVDFEGPAGLVCLFAVFGELGTLT